MYPILADVLRSKFKTDQILFRVKLIDESVFEQFNFTRHKKKKSELGIHLFSRRESMTFVMTQRVPTHLGFANYQKTGLQNRL